MRCCIAVSLAAAAARLAAASDRVASLPGYGTPQTKHLAGFVDATPSGKNRLFYYFVEAEIGSSSSATPLLIWLNGGPGASSMIGLFTENLGPQKITVDSRLVNNPDHMMKSYHVMAVDNPVGAGYSNTRSGAYVASEEEMREQFTHALRNFYELHPEYKKNPLWITGESYAGLYVPNIAYELATNAKEIPLKGVIIGNGLYNAHIQYGTVGPMAFYAGVIDERLLFEMQPRVEKCRRAIQVKQPKAGDFCENVTVRWLYQGPKAAAGEFFYYDFGIADAHQLDKLQDSLGRYLNREDVKEALHVGSEASWQCHDETGPVATALASDFTRPSTPLLASLLELGKEVALYNGVRDGSVCNHVGNLKALLNLTWSGASEFQASRSRPWPSHDNVMGHIRSARNLRFATILRTGHLVPTYVPDAFRRVLGLFLEDKGTRDTGLVV